MHDELIALHCAPTHISDYVSHWRTGLNCLASAGHLFDHADSLRHFAKHLLYGSTFDIIQESILFSLSTAQTADELLLFELIVECIMNVELNWAYFQPSHTCHLNSDPNPTPTSNATKDNTTTSSTSSTAPTLQPHPLRSNFQKPGGGQESGFTDRNKLLACAYVVDAEVDLANDGGAVSSEQLPSSPGVIDEDSPSSFAALGTTLYVPSTSALSANNDVFFDLYRTGVISTAFSLVSELSPICLSFISSLFNSILDSGCTHHIIKDHSYFWTYHTSQAIPVKTANCGVLETLAKGNVKVQLQCGTQSIVLVLQDCLHAPSAPINLLSVGAMQERQMHIHFNEDATIVHFPLDHPLLAGLSFRATVLHHLSFLQCDFITPDPPITDGSEVAFPAFPVV